MAAEILKKVFYVGVGAIALAVDKTQKLVEDLVQQGKISEEEGKKIVDDFVQSTEVKRGEFETRLRKITDSLAERFDFLSKEEVEEMKKRINELEDQLEGNSVVNAVADAITDLKETVVEAVETTKTKAKKVKAALVEEEEVVG